MNSDVLTKVPNSSWTRSRSLSQRHTKADLSLIVSVKELSDAQHRSVAGLLSADLKGGREDRYPTREGREGTSAER